MSGIEIVVALLIVAGLAGIVIPVLPGSVLVGGALLVYAGVQGTARSWIIFALAVLVIVAGEVIKYLLPGRQMKRAGVPVRSLVVGALLGVVGFFVVPVVGLFLGFVLGIYLSERQRLGPHEPAWVSTKHALRAVGMSMLIELVAGLAAAMIWLVGVFVLP